MINCKRCGDSSAVVKNGKVRNQQRYYCKSCEYNFVPEDKRQNRGYSEEVKALAVMLYGTMKCSYGMIARLLKTSRRTVYMWVKQAGNELPEPALLEKIEAIEFDEMWHFVQSKKKQIVDMESLRSFLQEVHRLGHRSSQRSDL